MSQKFVVSHLDQQMGPFDEQELKMKWASGEILPIDYVYDEAKEDWILLADRFPWAAKPIKDDGSAPPPIRDVNIIKRTPPPAKPVGEVSKVMPMPNLAAPATMPAPPLTLSENAPVNETLKAAMDIIRYTEIIPRKMETPAPAPTPAKPAEPAKVTAPKHELRVELPENTNVIFPKIEKAPDSFLKLDMLMPLAPMQDLSAHTPIAMPAPLAVSVPQPMTIKPLEVRATPPPPSHNGPLNSGHGTKVTLVNGVAEIDFTPTNPGNVELDVSDITGSSIKSIESLKIHVKAAEPVAVTWEYPSTQVVGTDVEVRVRALDDRGLVCEHYNDQYMIQIRGPVAHDVNVKMVAGQAVVLLTHTKAEKWEVSLHYSGTKHVKLPDASELEWQPGTAVRLILDGPHEYLAGDPMKVKVKAVDAYGNTAKTFQGTVALEVKAS